MISNAASRVKSTIHMPDRILLLRTWLSNIGNGFIEKGSHSILEQAFPDAEIIEASGYSNYVGDLEASYGLTQKIGLDRSNNKRWDHPDRERVLNIAEFLDPDAIVLPGCVLYDWALRKYATTFRRLPTDEVPVVFLGAGGGNYESSTQETIKEAFLEFDVDALLTRDTQAYECYSDAVPFSYNGIDCAFFIDEYISPPESSTPFTLHTFDKMDEPEGLNSQNPIIRPNHAPLSYPHEIHIRAEMEELLGQSEFSGENLFYSDSIDDYLFFYSNAEVTHTDRVHAAVPTLVYGGSARFYYETPRANLFDRVLSEDITQTTVSIDEERLEKEKANQVSAVRKAITTAMK